MELYHVLNRGVDKRDIFLDDQDRARFVHDMFEFNDTAPAGSTYYSFKNLDLVGPDFDRKPIERTLIVDVHGWCLMRNHYHLLLSEKQEGGITKFLMKLNVGYAKYFNKKYKRVGTLFQGRTKRVLINSDAHFLHILHYIHLNPLDFLSGAKNWRKQHISSSKKALEYLNKYRWSSYMDYCGKKNFPSILSRDLFSEVFLDYKKDVRAYLMDIDIETINELTLE